jgi:hypothetical protein
MCLLIDGDLLMADIMVSIERIKMPKRGVNWAFLKINYKN